MCEVSPVLCGQSWRDLITASVYETLHRNIKSEKAILYDNNRPSAQQTKVCLYMEMHEQGITWDHPESKIKTKQQRLLPYFFVTHEFNCLFLFGESAYVNYALLCWRKIRVKNIFQHKHKHFDRMQTWEVFPPHKSTPLSPATCTLKEIKHLSFLSFAPAELGIFE